MDFKTLVSELQNVPYPAELEMIRPEILGQGFFPAARGYTNDEPPSGGVMLLGQDWGTVNQFNQWRGEPAQNETAITSNNVHRYYLRALGGVPVWCTNYLLGARKSPLPATGDLETFVKDAEQWSRFEAACWRFLHMQVEFQRPAMIVLFGEPNRRRLSGKDRLATNWGHYGSATETVRACSRDGLQLSTTFQMSDGRTHDAMLTYAYHPCFGQGNARSALINADATRVANYVVDLPLM